MASRQYGNALLGVRYQEEYALSIDTKIDDLG